MTNSPPGSATISTPDLLTSSTGPDSGAALAPGDLLALVSLLESAGFSQPVKNTAKHRIEVAQMHRDADNVETFKRVNSTGSMFRSEPRRFFIAGAVGRQHEKIGVGGVAQIDDSIVFGGNGAKIPAGSINSDNFTRCLKGARFVRIAFAGGPAAERKQTAVWRPIHVINLIGMILDAQTPISN